MMYCSTAVTYIYWLNHVHAWLAISFSLFCFADCQREVDFPLFSLFHLVAMAFVVNKAKLGL